MKHLKLYLIHIQNSDGSIWHYIGTTTHETLRERFKHHMYGETKSFDHIKARGAIDVGLWLIKNGADVGEERLLQCLDEQSVRDHVCPRCRAATFVQTNKLPRSLVDIGGASEALD